MVVVVVVALGRAIGIVLGKAPVMTLRMALGTASGMALGVPLGKASGNP